MLTLAVLEVFARFIYLFTLRRNMTIITCVTYLWPLWGWVVDVFLSFLFIVLFFYLPIRLKTQRRWRIALFAIGGVLILFTQLFIINDYQCYQSFQPELVYDFNQQITTKEQAVIILQNYILENYFPKQNEVRNATTGQHPPQEEYLNEKEERREEIERTVVLRENGYSAYYFQWKFILYRNGKLYRQWAGD